MVKNQLAMQATDSGDTRSIPESGRFPGKGNGNPLQYSCWKNPLGRETWWVVVRP